MQLCDLGMTHRRRVWGGTSWVHVVRTHGPGGGEFHCPGCVVLTQGLVSHKQESTVTCFLHLVWKFTEHHSHKTDVLFYLMSYIQ